VFYLLKDQEIYFPDALPRLYQDARVQERRDHEPTFIHDVNAFISPVNTRPASPTSLKIWRSILACSTDTAVHGVLNNVGANRRGHRPAPQNPSPAGGDTPSHTQYPSVPLVPQLLRLRHLTAPSLQLTSGERQAHGEGGGRRKFSRSKLGGMF